SSVRAMNSIGLVTISGKSAAAIVTSTGSCRRDCSIGYLMHSLPGTAPTGRRSHPVGDDGFRSASALSGVARITLRCSTHPTPYVVRLRSIPSERRDGIGRRTGAAANRQRRCGQQEIPPVARRRRIRQRLEVAVVEEMHAEVEQREIMNRANKRGWRNV